MSTERNLSAGRVVPIRGGASATPPADDWPDPRPLIASAAPEYARGVYPGIVEAHADVVARACGASYAGAIVMADLTVAALCQGSVWVQRADGNARQPINVYRLVTGDPSTAKSGAWSAMTQPLKKIDLERLRASEHEAQSNRDHYDQIEHRIEKAKKGDASRTEIEAMRAEQRELGPRVACGVLGPASSPQAVAATMAESGGRALTLLAEEATPIFYAKGGFDGSPLADAGVYLKGYDGQPYTHRTAARGTETIERAVLSIATTIQPAKLAKVPDDDGLLSRFRVTMLGDVHRDWTKSIPTTRSEPQYEEWARRIADTWLDAEMMYLCPDSDADRMLGLYLNERDALARGRFSGSPAMGQWLGKRGELLRSAARIHLAHKCEGATMTTETIERAIAWDRVEIEHAALVKDAPLGVSYVDRIALAIIRSPALARERCARPGHEYQRHVGARCKTVRDAELALERLVSLGWARETDAPGRGRARHWTLHPSAGHPGAGQ